MLNWLLCITALPLTYHDMAITCVFPLFREVVSFYFEQVNGLLSYEFRYIPCDIFHNRDWLV